jgi:magnesium transporter
MDNMLTLARAFAERHTEAAVDALDELPPSAIGALMSELPADCAANLLTRMPAAQAAACMAVVPQAKTVAVVRCLAPQSAADILRGLNPALRQQILAALARWRRVQIELVLRQPRQTVGAWMDTRIATARPATNVGDALKRLRDDGSNDWLFVVGTHRHLAGAVRLGALMRAAPDLRVGALMRSPPPPLRANVAITAAMDHAGWQEHDILPVVEASNRLIGAISHVNLRRASSELEKTPVTNEHSGSMMDVANIVYLGMAEVMNATIARKPGPPSKNGPGRTT